MLKPTCNERKGDGIGSVPSGVLQEVDGKEASIGLRWDFAPTMNC